VLPPTALPDSSWGVTLDLQPLEGRQIQHHAPSGLAMLRLAVVRLARVRLRALQAAKHQAMEQHAWPDAATPVPRSAASCSLW
jgi:hypothetical protein